MNTEEGQESSELESPPLEETASNRTVLKHQDEKLQGSGHGREYGHRNVKETAVGTVWEMGGFEQAQGWVARKVGCNWIQWT